MYESVENPAKPVLRPTPFHEAILGYLKAEEAEVWRWYTLYKMQENQAESIRFELLKSTYRVDREVQPAIYATAADVAGKLGLEVPITIYQAQSPQGLNASLAYISDEAHIVLHGPVASRMTEVEFRALLAHELSHFLLWRFWNGEYLIAEQILAAMTRDALADTPHFATARLLALYNEVFCDRGALLVVGDPLVVVSMLLKVETELEEVSAESFLRQADEVIGHGGTKAEGLSHPEAFIRARAVKLWADGDREADDKIAEMLEGPPELNDLDFLAQKKVAGLTRRLLDMFLSRPWMQSEVILAHARLFFEDYVPPDAVREDSNLANDLRTNDRSMQDYYCYVLLDFVTADRDLEELPLAAALVLTEKIGLKDRFVDIVRRELRLRKKQLETIDRDKESLLVRAHENGASA